MLNKIEKHTLKILKDEQAKLGKLIIKNNPSFQWISLFNAERLRLCLLVEIGELANEIKSFKAWHKKQEVDWIKVKEELIDCLSFFLDLSNLFQINFVTIFTPYDKQDFSFNEILLELFVKTNNLYIEKNKNFYELKKTEIKEVDGEKTYYDWLETFVKILWKLQIDEKEMLEIYLKKNRVNQARASTK